MDLLKAWAGLPAKIGKFAALAPHLADREIGQITGAVVGDEIGELG